MLAGAVCIRGTSLRFKAKAGELEVRAPIRFLNALYEWCDGSRTASEMAALANGRWGVSRFVDFVEETPDAGVLIDASRLLESAFDAVQLPSALGRSSPEETWETERHSAHASRDAVRGPLVRLPEARAPQLTRLADARRSSPGFANGNVSATQIAALLDGMYGLSAGAGAKVATLGRRNTPSAGAFNALRISLVLTQPLSDVPPGVDDVIFERAGKLGLRRRGEAGTRWCRALLDVHRWLLAKGLVVVSADTSAAALKYKSRALHFALIETGASLQNAGLAAAELGIGFRVLGGYYPDRLAQLCHLEGERVLGCAVFGALVQEDEPARRTPRKALRFDWAEAGDDNPVYIAGRRSAEYADFWHRLGSLDRCARGLRHCHLGSGGALFLFGFGTLRRRHGKSARRGGRPAGARALCTRPIPTRGSCAVHPFDPGKRYLWAPARQRGSDLGRWVPAECVYAASALPKRFASQAITRTTSSGCATDADVNVAIERASLRGDRA